MASVVVNGDTSGAVTLSAPAVAGTVTVTLPAATGTMLTTASTTGISGSAISSGTVPEAYGGTGTSTGYYGFKNRIINGQMTTDQRNAGASQTFTAGGALAYSVDRFYGFCTGANVTGQQVAGASATQFRYRFTGAASVATVGFGQRIEQKNSYDLAGSTATLSADLAISATLTTVTWTASYATTTADTFGTLASPTVTQIATGTFTVTSTVTNFSTNITIPAAATTGIQIVFTVGALTAGLTWTIGNVQLEKGSTATSFDYRPYGTELALCQRYYEKVDNGNGVVRNSTVAFGQYYYRVEKRATATVTLSGTSGVYVNNNGDAAVTGFAAVKSNTYGFQGQFTSSGMTAGYGAYFDLQNGSQYISASAEL